MNNISITANLTKDVELKYTASGVAVANLGLAINSGFGDKKETCFITAVVWKAQAENAEKYLRKGSKIALTGSLRQRSWEDNQGNKRSVIEINAHMVDYLDPKGTIDNSSSFTKEKETETIETPINLDDVIIPGEEELF